MEWINFTIPLDTFKDFPKFALVWITLTNLTCKIHSLSQLLKNSLLANFGKYLLACTHMDLILKIFKQKYQSFIIHFSKTLQKKFVTCIRSSFTYNWEFYKLKSTNLCYADPLELPGLLWQPCVSGIHKILQFYA